MFLPRRRGATEKSSTKHVSTYGLAVFAVSCWVPSHE